MKQLSINPTLLDTFAVSYIDFENKPVEFTSDKHPDTIRAEVVIKETRAKIKRLYDARLNAYKYSNIPHFKLDAIDALRAGQIRLFNFNAGTYKAFLIFVSDFCLPHLETLRPGRESRFYANYTNNLKIIRLLINKEFDELTKKEF